MQEPAVKSFKALTRVCSKDRQAATALLCKALTLTQGSPEAWLSKLLHLHLVSSVHNIPKGRPKHLFCNTFSKNNNYLVKMCDHYRPSPPDKGQYSTHKHLQLGVHDKVTERHSQGRAGDWSWPEPCCPLPHPTHAQRSPGLPLRTHLTLHCKFCRRITGACCTARICASSLQSVTPTKSVQQVPKGWVKGSICPLPAG